MDLGFNKVAFCVLATGLMLIGLNEASHAFFPGFEPKGEGEHHAARKPGFLVEVAETPTGPVEAVEEGPRDYNKLISMADIEAGKAVAVKCQQCHSLAGTEVIQGPPLFGVIGRKSGSVAGFKYSTDMAAQSNHTWDYDHFDHFIEAPKKIVPGTAMNFAGIKKQKDRADLMAYLRTLTTGEPLPLPPPLPEGAATPAAAPADGAAPAATPAAATPGAPGPAATPAPATPAPAQH